MFGATRVLRRLENSLRKRLQRVAAKSTQHDGRWLASADSARRLLERGDFDGAEQIWRALEIEYGDCYATSSISRLYQTTIAQLRNIEAYRATAEEHLSQSHAFGDEKLRITIYTAITDGYDSLKLPHAFDPKYRYVLFCDHPTTLAAAYEPCDTSYLDADPVRTARYVKTHPHFLLEGCDIAIWIDANIAIVDSIDDCVRRFLDSKLLVAAVPNAERRSLQEEIKACALHRRDDRTVLRYYADVLKRRGFETSELAETSLMMFDLRDAATIAFLGTWWSEINCFSRLDRLSFNFALASHDLRYHAISSPRKLPRNHPSFCQVPHDFGDGPSRLVLESLSPMRPRLHQRRSYLDVREARIRASRANAIDVVVCVHNALEDVQRCLHSLAEHRSGEHLRLVLVDDGSDDPTRGYLEKFVGDKSWAVVLRADQASGYTRAANRGIAYSSAPFVILLNSDTIVTDGWAEKMADAAAATKGVGVVGPLSNAAGPQSIPEIKGTSAQSAINRLPPGHSPQSMNRLCEEWTDEYLLPRVPVVHGFCLGLTREAIETVGGFDEKLYPRGYGEETDFCFRVNDAGLSLVIATHTFVYHAKSKSYADKARLRLVKESRQKLRASFGEARLKRANLTMRKNPHLELMRTRAGALGLWVESGD